MSRCLCCNDILDDSELVRKDSRGEYLDTCTKCLTSSFMHDGWEYNIRGDKVSFTGVRVDRLKWGYAGGVQDVSELDFNIELEEKLDN